MKFGQFNQKISPGDIWLALFPYEENKRLYKQRPVVIVSVDEKNNKLLAAMVTSHEPRYYENHIPKKHDFVLIDEEGEVCESVHDIGVLSKEMIITWPEIDDDVKLKQRENLLA